MAGKRVTNRRRLKPYRQSLAGTLLNAREAVMSPIRPILRAANITEQQWRVLRVLLDEGPVDPSRLAHSALLHAPSVTRILRELIDRGWIRRDADPDDGRRAVIAISDEGAATVAATAKRTLSILDRFSAAFGQERFDRLIAELVAFTAAIDDRPADP